jgi:hypothetical protein
MTGLMDDRIVGFIGHTAARFGLNAFDMQAGFAFCSDGRVLYMDGSEEAIPVPRKPGMSEPEVVGALMDAIAGPLQRAEWSVDRTAKSAGDWRLWRRRGPVLQMMGFRVLQADHGAGVVVVPWLAFASRTLQQALRKALPEEAAMLDREVLRNGPRHRDIFTTVREMAGMGTTRALLHYANLADPSGIAKLAEQFLSWYGTWDESFDDATTVPGLARLLVTPWRMKSTSTWDDLTLLSSLALAAHGDRALFDDWCAMSRERAKGRASAASVDKLASHLAATRLPSKEQMLEQASTRLAREFARHGYKHDPSYPTDAEGAASRAYRLDFPTGWHVIVVHMWEVGAEREMRMVVDTRLNAVSDLIAMFAYDGQVPADAPKVISARLRTEHWLEDPRGLAGPEKRGYVIRTPDDLEIAAEHLAQQVEPRLMPILDRARSYTGFDALVNTNPLTASMYFEDYERCSRNVAAAHVARSPRLEAIRQEIEEHTRGVDSDAAALVLKCIEYSRRIG